MHKCNHCNDKFEKLTSLRRHVSRVHKIKSQEFYNEYVLNGEIPTCKCGCGEETTFVSFNKGYNEWIRGHISRVKNNWGHNPTAIENSAQTRREQYKNGDREVWNKGLTKEDHPSIAKYGKGVSNTINSNNDELTRRSDYMKFQWETDPNFKIRCGKDAPRWNGGTSTINSLVRSNKRLYDEWIYPILKEQNFQCQTCGDTGQLEVHHSEETMSEILNKLIDDISDYTFDEKKEIMNEVIDYHIENEVKGEVLCKSCHMKLHPSYNL